MYITGIWSIIVGNEGAVVGEGGVVIRAALRGSVDLGGDGARNAAKKRLFAVHTCITWASRGSTHL